MTENWSPGTGGPACDWCGECLWCDPCSAPVGVFEGTRWHMHAEPICADPDCITYLTHDQMRDAHQRAAAQVRRRDRHTILVQGITITANDSQEQRIAAMTAEQRARFLTIMGRDR